VLLFEIVLGSPPEQIVCALPIDPADGAEHDEQAPSSIQFPHPACELELGLLLEFAYLAL
jgi:hypothetical protein